MMKCVSDCNGEGLSGEKPKRPLSDEQGDCSDSGWVLHTERTVGGGRASSVEVTAWFPGGGQVPRSGVTPAPRRHPV